MPDEGRAEAKRDANRTVWFFRRLLALGLSQAEACDLTVAWVLGRLAGASGEEERERDSAEDWKRE